MMNYFFVLGAPDPECKEIESILIDHGISYAYALHEGQRVRSFSAYNTDDIEVKCLPVVHPTFDAIVTVECGGPFLQCTAIAKLIQIDHHSEGDAGFGRPPEDYWNGSSLGQVCNLLGLEKTKDRSLIAAADHCLGAAYLFKCPDISPQELLEWRVRQKANYKKVSYEDIMSRIENAICAIRDAKTLTLNGEEVVDFTYFPMPFEAEEAASIIGKSMMYSSFVKGLGKYKFGITSTKPELVEHWMKVFAVKLGLNNVYGDPKRGYAGGYSDTDIRGQ